MQSDNLSIPGLEAARRLGRLSPKGQREMSAIERLRSWDGRLDPDSIAGTIYQAFLLRLAREVARAAIGDRDLCERWLDRADNGFTPHVTSPWRWHSHLMKLWEEGDEELIGRPWDDLVLEALAGALDDLTDRFGPDPEGWRWGHVHEMEFPHPLGDANPLLRKLLNRSLRAGGAQETVSQIAYDPNDPYRAVWAPSWRMVGDPTAPERSRWQMFTGQSGHPASPHYDDLQADWLEGRTQPMAGEGPWRELDLVPPPETRTSAAFMTLWGHQHSRSVVGRHLATRPQLGRNVRGMEWLGDRCGVALYACSPSLRSCLRAPARRRSTFVVSRSPCPRAGRSSAWLSGHVRAFGSIARPYIWALRGRARRSDRLRAGHVGLARSLA